MHVDLEDFVPYDRSVLYRINDAYWTQRGIAAWQHGEIPHFSTNNYGMARQHADLFVALVDQLEREGVLRSGDPVPILEVGGGLGLFAANFVRALRKGCGVAGRALARRLVYIFSDYAETNLREAADTRELEPLVREGVVRLALCDIRDRGALELLDGGEVPPLVGVIANYVACVAGSKHLRKGAGGWRQLYVKVRATVDPADYPRGATARTVLRRLEAESTRANLLDDLELIYDWRPTDLEKLYRDHDPAHPGIIRTIVEDFDEATLTYPRPFLDFVRGVSSQLVPGGWVLVNDYGSSDRRALRGHRDRRPQHYGNTYNHDVNFGIFDGFTAVTEWEAVRVSPSIRSVHHALLRVRRAVPDAVRARFQAIYEDRQDGEDMLDLSAAARNFYDDQEYSRAIRLYSRCLRLDPESPTFWYRVGEACLEGGYYDMSVEHLQRGFALDVDSSHDFEFQLGRVYCLMQRYPEALEWYERSIARDDHPVTRTNMAVILQEMGRYEDAYLELKRALDLDPGYERGRERLDELKDVWWTSVTTDLDQAAARPTLVRRPNVEEAA